MKNIDIKYVVHPLLALLLVACSNSEDIITKNNDADFVGNYFSTFNFQEPTVTGKTYYLDPVKGSLDGDGSKEKPWPSLEEVIKAKYIATFKKHNGSLQPLDENGPIKGGDRLILKEGYHGVVSKRTMHFKKWLSIEGAVGEKAILAQLHLNGITNNLYLKNIYFIRDKYKKDGQYKQDITAGKKCFYIETKYKEDAKNVKVYDCKFMSTENASNWTAEQWRKNSAGGLLLRTVEGVDIVNCTFKNIRGGISMGYYSNKINVVGNTITNYCGDGIRISANNVLLENNSIKNLYNINTSPDPKKNFHYDGIQLWSTGPDGKSGKGTIENITIRGNFVYDNRVPKPNFLDQGIQGIGGFDGMFKNVLIENNVVAVSSWHGISLNGAINCKIINNTVVDTKQTDKESPRILIVNHKSYKKTKDKKFMSKNCLIANNIVASGVGYGKPQGDNLVEKNNLLFKKNYSFMNQYFNNPSSGDYYPKSSELTKKNIINKGVDIKNAFSSKFDKDGIARKNMPDLGAYEVK